MTAHSAITDRWAYPHYGGSGRICSTCGYWAPDGCVHHCGPVVVQWQGSWQCPSCRQQVSGFHICSGAPAFMPVAPEQRPESPLAALVADVRALLAKGQSWLAEKKL